MTTDAQPSQPEAKSVDQLLKLVQHDIPRDQERLKTLKGSDPQRVATEISGTVLEYLREVAERLLEVRDWSYQSMTAISEHLEATDDRLDVIETFGGDTTMLPEDAELFAKIIVGCKFLAQNLLTGPFPIGERDEAGKTKLAELIAMCEQAERIVSDSVLTDDDDEDDDDFDDDQDEDDDEPEPR